MRRGEVEMNYRKRFRECRTTNKRIESLTLVEVIEDKNKLPLACSMFTVVLCAEYYLFKVHHQIHQAVLFQEEENSHR